MNEWKKYKLGEVVEIVGGGTPKTSVTEYWNGEIPWLSVVDFNTGKKFVYETEKTITQKGLENSSTKILNAGDIIISARGTVGAIAVLGRDMAFNQSCYGIKNIPELTDKEFIYYLIKDSITGFLQIAHGGVFDTITRETFHAIDIILPPPDEQKAIASVLCSLDDKIDLLHRQNKTLEAMAETVFRQWFVENADEKWEMGKIDEIMTVKGGSTPSTRNPEYWDGNIYWATPRDLSNNAAVYLLDSERKITASGLEQINSGILPIGTILLSSRAPIGYLAITEIPTAINQGFIAILDNKGYSKEFLYLWLKYNLEYITASANGSVFLEISKSVFKNLKIQKPPIVFIESFNFKVKPLFEKIRENIKQVRILEALRNLVLPALMHSQEKNAKRVMTI